MSFARLASASLVLMQGFIQWLLMITWRWDWTVFLMVYRLNFLWEQLQYPFPGFSRKRPKTDGGSPINKGSMTKNSTRKPQTVTTVTSLYFWRQRQKGAPTQGFRNTPAFSSIRVPISFPKWFQTHPNSISWLSAGITDVYFHTCFIWCWWELNLGPCACYVSSEWYPQPSYTNSISFTFHKESESNHLLLFLL